MNIFYSKSQKGFFVEGINRIPEGSVQVSNEIYQQLLEGQNAGFSIDSNSDGFPILVETKENEQVIYEKERAWRDSELKRADVELYKVQDSDPKAFGSVSQWRDYRKALRAWPENPSFPESKFRPKAPDQKE